MKSCGEGGGGCRAETLLDRERQAQTLHTFFSPIAQLYISRIPTEEHSRGSAPLMPRCVSFWRKGGGSKGSRATGTLPKILETIRKLSIITTRVCQG